MLAFIKQEKGTNDIRILQEYYKFSKLFEELDNNYYLLEHKP